MRRERLKAALNHQEGAVPIDFASTGVTGIHVSIVAGLREYFGLEHKPVKVIEPYQLLGFLDDDLKEALKLDTIGIFPPVTLFGFSLEGWKEWRTPWGQEVLVSQDFEIREDENSIFAYPKGDKNVPPSGHMPKTSFFFDTIIRQLDIVEDKLNPVDNFEEFGVVSDEQLDYYKKEIERADKKDLGVVTGLSGTAFGDIALVPAPFLKNPKGIRDITEWYISTVTRPDYIQKIFDKQLEYALLNLEKLHHEIGDKIDVLFICGTDFGTQNGTFCSIETYRKLWKPYYRQLNDWIHSRTSWKTFKHSCGAVFDFVEEFIESGFDILNPIQCSAAGMSPVALKQQYGDRIVFWGGGVDTQRTLPFGTPQEVKEQVLERCRIFSKNGGFVFNSIHNIQAQTPVENVVAMFEAVWEFNV